MRHLTIFLLAGMIAGCGNLGTQEREVPYWATIRAKKLNMRVGPSAEYAVSWVYDRQGLPMKVLRVHEGWRLVRDPAGAEGWVVARLLSPDHGAIVTGKEPAEMRDAASADGNLLWRAEPGVVGSLHECDEGWCLLDVDGRAGWVRESRLWGAGNP